MKESEFTELLQYSLNPDRTLYTHFSQDDWARFYKLAKKHSILGVTFRGMDSLPPKIGPSFVTHAKWAFSVEAIKKNNRLFDLRSAELTKLFAEAGFRSCILKGQSIALYYPDPSLRQCGDIDIWIDGKREEILDFLQRKGYKPSSIVYHHCKVHFFDDVNVEVHFLPSFMNSSILDRRLQNFFRSCADAQFSNFHPENGYCSPDTAFATIHSVVHIFRHLFHEGIGLRQIIDLYYLLQALPSEKKDYVFNVLKRLNLAIFVSALMWVLSFVLDLDEKYLLCPVSKNMGIKLYNEILKAGNFGLYDPMFPQYQSNHITVRAWNKISRLFGLFRFCPQEVISAPAFKLWQHLWRIVHNYY